MALASGPYRDLHSSNARELQMRIAVVGLGSAGRTLHLPALTAISGVDIVGVFDTDPRARASVAERWDVPAFTGFAELLERAHPDVVVVGTPPDSHASYCFASLRAGAHVICEKPFVSSVAEADAVIAVATQADRCVALNHEFREMPILSAVRDEIGGNAFGRLVFAQVWQNIYLPPSHEPGWRGQLVQRTLFEAGIHIVDFLVTLFGERPHSVTASVSTGGDGQSGDAVVVACLEFSGGRLAQIVQNRVCRGQSQYFEVRADGTRASVRASFGGRARLSVGLLRSAAPHLRVELGAAGLAWRERGARRTILARNPRDPGMKATRSVFQRSLAAFASGSKPPTSAEEARDILEIIAGCYYSASTGRRVVLGEADREQIRDLRMGVSSTGD